MMKYFSIFAFAIIGLSCSSAETNLDSTELSGVNPPFEDSVMIEKPLYCNANVVVGAGHFDEYIGDLEGMKVGIVGNQSSMIGETHLVDSLIALGVNVVKVFSPEHGFRGKADAGEKVQDGIDNETGLPIISLYGSNKKPKAAQLSDIDILLFDIQDVGARFYTYISTLNYVMEAAAETGKKVIVLDRPNPNGHYVDGPVLEDSQSSFVGMNPVPVVHGMSIAEYAQMIKGEAWINKAEDLDLKVVKCSGWDHNEFYELPIAPSPNLPNMKSVYLYPNLCFFEGTEVSVGRGTDIPFQCLGHPKMEVDVLEDLYSFKPEPNDGASKPKLMGETCYGFDYSNDDVKEMRARGSIDFIALSDFYLKLDLGKEFFLTNNFFNLLAGNSELKVQIMEGISMSDIREGWEPKLDEFKEMRKKYLLYTDFD
ncbi:MAG: hypothetical protein ACI857_001665 [Arenicella sp.]|jgi:uncharacterized protein YbbC (DUF1343 family)